MGVRFELGQVEVDEFGAAQAGGQQHVHDRAVPVRPGVPVRRERGVAALMAAALS
ncbi:MAG: hypothetical protein ACRDQ4_11790 [Pseudonocardiaceae bacterium]